MTKPGISVQMYTLRDLSSKDFLGTFDHVAKIGFTGVELAGTGNLPAPTLKKHLDNLGLVPSGAHVSIEQLESDLNKQADYFAALGCKNIICPWWPENRRAQPADWLTASKILNDIGAKLRAQGFTFAYHNHDFEFQKVDNKFGLDIIFDNADPQNLQVELDCYWVARAGQDPAAFITAHPNRVPFLHIKDMAPGPDKKFANVGHGVIDFQPIFAAAAVGGTQWYIIEQDNSYDQPPLEGITNGYHSLKKWGLT